MGKIMILIEAVRNLDSFDDGNTIYASEPWNEESKVMVEPEPESGGLPVVVMRNNMKYFLEVFLAKEFLDDWISNLTNKPTAEEKCARLIQYAINDA
jgi:hypothetical protein